MDGGRDRVMKNKGIWNTWLAVPLCGCAALAVCMQFAAPASLTGSGRAALTLANLAESLAGRMLPLLLCFGACYALCRHVRRKGTTLGVLFHIFCAVVAGIWLLAQGFQIDNTLDSLTAVPGQMTKSLLYLVGSFAVLELAGAGLIDFLDSGVDLRERGGLARLYREHCFAAYFVTLLICCLPTWIICYPGYLVPDSYCQLAYYFGIYAFYGQFPPIHTLLISLPVKLGTLLGSANLGLFLVVCVQMLCFAAVFAYLMDTLYQLGAPHWLRLFSFLLIVTGPYFIVQAAYVSKDTPYSYGALLYILETVWLFRLGDAFWKNRRHRLLLILGIILTMLMRTNGKYLIYVCTLVYGLVLLLRGRRHPDRKRFATAALCLLCPVLLSLAAEKAVVAHYDIIPGSRREALSLPFQQTARYLFEYGEDAAPEELDAINAVISAEDIPEFYYPMDSSPVKQFFNDEADGAQLIAYFRVWLRQGLRHPLSYIKATMNQNYPLFCPWTTNALQHGETESSRHVHISEPIGLYDVHLSDGLEDSMRALDRLLARLPFPGLLINASGCTLLLLVLCCVALHRRRWAYLLYALPGLLTMGTIFLAPTVDPRFALPIIYSMPLLLCLFLRPGGIDPAF